LPNSAFKMADIGSFITANDANGNCFGVASWNEENTSITLFGDDPLTPKKDGFIEGEPISFKWIDGNDIYDLKVEYDQIMPVSNGRFAVNGLSAVKSVKVSSQQGNPNMSDGISIYPNPANESVFINLSHETEALSFFYDTFGQVIIDGKLSKGENRISLSDLEPGVYLIKITDHQSTKVFKLIKR